MRIQQLSDEVLDVVAEDAMNKAFIEIQNRLGVESGDFASSWVMPHEINKFKSWLIAYAKAEMNFDLKWGRERSLGKPSSETVASTFGDPSDPLI